MNLDAPPLNAEVAGQDKQFSAPWKRSLNQLYAFVKSIAVSAAGITSLTGDVSATGPGAAAATLANVNGSPGTYPNATVTVDAKGRVTNAATGAPGGITALTGDVIAAGSGSVVAALKTIPGVAGTYTALNATVDSNGRVTVAANGTAAVPAVTFNKQTANYTLVLSDVSLSTPTMVQMNLVGANTLTVSKNSTTAYPIGVTVGWQQYGAGQTTLTPAAGVTFRTSGSLTSRTQYSSGTMIQLATDEWLIEGDTS